MSITAYTGLPGSGKSYEVVNGPILDATKNGRPVWTNIPCNIDGVHVVTGDAVKGHWYLDTPPGALCVVDECWRYWPAGMKADAIPEAHRSWFAEHRHRTADGREFDIVVVTQDLSQVARFVRELVDETFRMRKLNAIGLGGSYRVDVYRGAVTGQRPPESQHISGGVRRYKKEGFARYKSHTQGEAAKRQTVDARGNALRRPGVWLLVAVLVAVPFVPGMLRALFVPTDAQEHAEKKHQAEPVAPATVPVKVEAKPTEPPTPAGPQESKEWTLLGIVTRADGSGRAILRSPTGRRVIDVARCRHSVEWVCDIDGRIVAEWTGNGVLARATGTTYNKANPD